MAIVPSTPTSADRTLEAKQIADKIAELITVKEHWERQATTAIDSATRAAQRLEALTIALVAMESTIGAVGLETREFVANCAKVMQESEKKIEDMITLAHTSEQSAIKSIQRVQDAEEMVQSIHASIVAENAVLDRKKEDLDIYHNRLKEYFAKYLPDQHILL